MPKTVTAIMSNGKTKELAVTWIPETIDTSKSGRKEAVGTVEGFNGTVVFTVIVEVVETGNAQISLFKDSNSSSNKIGFENITNFYLKNKKTGEEFNIGSSPWNNESAFVMKDIPVGEYTLNFESPEGLGIKKILIGEAYKETEYDAETNPFVIVKGKSNYADIILQSEITLKEIQPLNDLVVPVDITLDEFVATLPKQAIIVDTTDKEHQVNLKWDIRPFNFESWKKPGEYTIWSEFFKLPISVSNSDPAQRLEAKLNVKFVDNGEEVDLEGAKLMIKEAKDALKALDNVHSDMSFNKGNFSKAESDSVQKQIDAVLASVNVFPNSDDKTDLISEIATLQKSLDEKVASRYVYYEVVKDGTNFTQLKLNISALVEPGVSGRTQNNNPMYVNSMGEENMMFLKYSNFPFVKPTIGDTLTLNLRFLGNVKNIDATFTNLGGGKWKVESDWLVIKSN